MSIKEKQQKAFESLKGELGLTNTMQTPKIVKVIVSSGVGSAKDKNKPKVVLDRLARITGQQPAIRNAKKSIASFKVREGDLVGYQVTLRGPRMFDFLSKLLHIALPRTKDFRGLSKKAVDNMGNLTIGIREHTIFPETGDEELKDVFGVGVTVVTTAKDKKSAAAYFEYLGFPFRKVEATRN